MAIPRDVGAPTKRNTAAFLAQWEEIGKRIDDLPTNWNGKQGRVIRGGSDGLGAATDGPIDFAQDLIRGGRIESANVPNGNFSFLSTETGLAQASLNEVDVEWTVSADAQVGCFIPWLQLGSGKITFKVTVGGTLWNVDNSTKSSGINSEGMLRVIKLNPDGKAFWKLTGETE